MLKDPIFKAAVRKRWNELRQGPWSNSSVQQLVDDAATLLQSNGAVERNYAKWDKGIGVNYDQSIQNLSGYLGDRLSWMDGKIGAF
jgi:hypothetical protein